MTPDETRPQFPTDDATLAAVEHALGAVTEIDAAGERSIVGADFTLGRLLDFLSGTLGDDPDATIIDPGRVETPDDLPPFLRGITSAQIVLDSRPRYSEHDLIGALVAEIRRLRSTELGRYAALWCERCGWHQYQHDGPGVDPWECPECRAHHGNRAPLRAVQCVIQEAS